MGKYADILNCATLFRGIDEAETEAMLKCLGARTASYVRGEYILRAGTSPSSIGLVLSGSVLIVSEDFWGNRDIRARISAGQVFAEVFACVQGAVMDVSAVADAAVEVLWLDVQRVLCSCPTACEHHAKMIRNLLSLVANGNLRMNEKLTHISRRSTREKLLSYLSAEAERQGVAEFSIPFDRQQLADYLSVERSAMSAELSRMQRDGLLRTVRNRFTLLC